MTTLREVLVDALWVIGLSGLLATYSYMEWYRSLKRWSWSVALGVPRLLFPFCLSMAVLCLGFSLKGLVAYQQASWWEIAIWTLLLIFFLIQSVIYGMAGQTRGWDKAREGRTR
jgi:hypothetical protein